MRTPLLSLTGAVALLLAPAAPAASIGHIANPLTDTKVVAPLKKAETIWDVFQVINDWVRVAYPAETAAGKAAARFDAFIKQYNTEEAKTLRAPRTVEMPISVDHYVKMLRKDAPGIDGNPMPEDLVGDPKAQLFVAGVLPLIQLRGIAYRLRPLVSTSMVLHNGLVNALRKMKQDLRVRSGNNGLALFEFVTYPLAGREREPVQFARFSELQRWIEASLIPTMDVSIQIAENAFASMDADQKFSADLSVFLQAINPFPDEGMEPAHRTLGRPEIQASLARMYAQRAAVRALCAYNLDSFSAFSNKMRKVYVNAFMREKIAFSALRKKPRTGTPPVVRYRILQKFGELFSLRNPEQGPLILADLRRGWAHFDAAMNEGFSTESDDVRFVDFGRIRASRKDYQKKVAPQISAVLSGATSINDYVGGATVDIDLPGFLSGLPADLKGFTPSEFADEQQPYWTFQFSSGDLAYTNYDFGTAVGWDKGASAQTWGRLFPNMPDSTSREGHWDGPLTLVRDLSRTYVGKLLAPIMAQAVY